MKRLIWRINLLLFAVCIISVSALKVCAKENAQELKIREQVQASCETESLYAMFDGADYVYREYKKGTVVSLKCEQGIGSLYIQFYRGPERYTVCDEDTGKTITCGEHGFLNEFVDLAAGFGYAPQNVTIRFDGDGTQICEMRMFSEGEPPANVQRWEAPRLGEVDLMLFSTHADDEQLFFAGLLPDYGCERGYNVLVVYLTGHPDMGVIRQHELLNGLWAVGCKIYPVIGKYNDFYSMDKAVAYRQYAGAGVSREDIIGYIVEQLRKYHPMVAVGHDLLGEYGHGAHQMYAELLLEALKVENDPSAYPELAEQYGLWETPKAYLHSYPENQIVMDWDVPLESFQGMTAFEVSRDLGFPAHRSQVPDFQWYLNGHATAASIREHGPCDYGMCRSLVGPDVEKNDFFENISSHAQQEAEK